MADTVMLWKMATDSIQTKGLLATGMPVPNIFCPLCHQSPETDVHLVFLCPLTRNADFTETSALNLTMEE